MGTETGVERGQVFRFHSNPEFVQRLSDVDFRKDLGLFQLCQRFFYQRDRIAVFL